MSGLLRSIESNAPKWTILIRIAVGVVFTSEGIQKFLYPDALGAGRFAKIGIPAPDVMGPFVGVVETVCGLLILAGLLTRLVAVPLIIDMLVAIASTKLPILLGRGYFLFSDPSVSKTGFWSMMHEARTDLSMLLGSSFLLLVGAGAWSLDARLRRHIGSNTGGKKIRALAIMLALVSAACPRTSTDSSAPLPSQPAEARQPPEGEAWLLARHG